MTAKFIRSILIPLVFLISNCSQNSGGEITGITTEAPAPTPPMQTANTVRKIEKKRIEISAASLKNAKERIAKVVFHSNLLWTPGQNGVLLQTDLAKKRAAPFEYADYVADVYIGDKNELYLLTSDGADASVWRILKRDDDGWSEASAFKIDREQKKKDEDAENPNAVLAAVGLRHFSEQGRVVKVSGGNVDVVFNKTYKSDEKSRKVVPENACGGANEPNNLDNFESEGVFGMQSAGAGDVWIVTGRAIYKLAGGKIAHCSPLPQKFENVAGIAVNESVSGVVLIGTGINWAKSLSGVTPLVAVKH